MKLSGIFSKSHDLALLYAALILVFIASVRHVAYSYSTIDGGSMFVGYLAAIAIDLGLIVIARAQARHPDRTLFRTGVVIFISTSVYSNWISGLAHNTHFEYTRYSNELINYTVSFFVEARPFVLSMVLPVMILYLTEVIARETAPPRTLPTLPTEPPEPIKHTPLTPPRTSQSSRLNTVKILKGRGMDAHEIADELSLKPRTIRKYLRKLTIDNPDTL